MARETMTLPDTLVSQVDTGRLVRELEAIDDAFRQAKHQDKTAQPRISAGLQAMVDQNSVDLTDDSQREQLATFLKTVRQKAPVVHMSFAAEPDAVFTSKILAWLRKEINPYVLLDIGLQPSIAAGCIIRTNSKYFDCSMRQHLLTNRPKLVDLIRGSQHA